MNCKNPKCRIQGGAIILKEEYDANDGLCAECKQILEATKKIASDLLSSFGGFGKRGFVQWLKKGKFLQVLEDDGDAYYHNDRVETVELMIGGSEKMDKLIDAIADVILKVAKEGTENA